MHLVGGCYHDPEYVMKIDDVFYHGASKHGVKEFQGDLVINFTGVSNIPSACNIPKLAPHISLGFEKEVMVPWPDFDVPLVEYTFWKALHEYILENEWELVCFHCAAGHGRTGTALSAMLVAIQGYTPTEALWHVRTHYCTEAVETQEQCNYLKELDKYYNDRIDENEDMIPSMVLKMMAKSADG